MNLKVWQSNLEIWQRRNDTASVDFAEGVIFGLELAIMGLKEQCNTKTQNGNSFKLRGLLF